LPQRFIMRRAVFPSCQTQTTKPRNQNEIENTSVPFIDSLSRRLLSAALGLATLLLGATMPEPPSGRFQQRRFYREQRRQPGVHHQVFRRHELVQIQGQPN